MSFRFTSSFGGRNSGIDCGIFRRDAGPDHLQRGIDAIAEGGVTRHGPDQQRAQNRLAKNVGDFRGRQVLANFTALLSDLHHLFMQCVRAILLVDHRFPNRIGGQVAQQKRANHSRIAQRLLGHAQDQAAHKFTQRLLRRGQAIDGLLELCQLQVGESE